MPSAAPAGPLGRLLAWLGGGAFIASLSLCGWCYLVTFARQPSTDAGIAGPIAWNAGLFSLFALHHSVMARTGAKQWMGRLLPPALERSLYIWTASLLLAMTCLAWQPIPGLLYRLGPPWNYACVAIQVTGVWMTLRSAGAIDVLELAGIRQAMGWPTAPRFKVIGPYHLVRHPIYLGWILMTFATPTMTATKLAFAAISTAYLAIAIPFEERSLVEVFGDEYREYQRRVRWRMVPGIY